MTAVLIILIILLIVLVVGCVFITNQLMWTKTFPLPKFIGENVTGNLMPGEYDKAVENMKKELDSYLITEEEIYAPDGARLLAHVYENEKNNGKLIIACHGARSSGIGEFAFMMPYFKEKGFSVIMPEHRGCGQSDGKFMGYGTHESKDTFLWVDYAKEHFPDRDIYLLGVSMGAATVLMMSENATDDKIKGIIADCSYTSAWDEFKYQLKSSFKMPPFPLLHMCDLISRIFAGYSFKDASPIDSVKKAKKPILFIHGKADDFVPFFMMDELYNACSGEKYCVAVEDAVHARSYYTNPALYQNEIERFIERCDFSRSWKLF